jgi:hypothetical protein
MDRTTLVNAAGREVYVDTAEAEAAFRAKGYLAPGEEPPKPEVEDEPGAEAEESEDDKSKGKTGGKTGGRGK